MSSQRPPEPAPPGALGQPIEPEALLDYLSALHQWCTSRSTELDHITQSVHADRQLQSLMPDIMLAFTLWNAVDQRRAELETQWDSGRVGEIERIRMSELIWGRLDSGHGAALLSMVDAVRACEALLQRLRIVLVAGSGSPDISARVAELRAALARCRSSLQDQVHGVQPSPGTSAADTSSQIEALAVRLEQLAASAAAGANIAGPLGELEVAIAQRERDIIVANARRRILRDTHAQAEQMVRTLTARSSNLRALAGRCRREIADPPRLAIPDVARLGPVPASSDALAGYVDRLQSVGQAISIAEDAYAAPLRQRANLRYRLSSRAHQAHRSGLDGSPTVQAAYREALDTLEATPCDIDQTSHLVDQYLYLTRPRPARGSSAQGVPR